MSQGSGGWYVRAKGRTLGPFSWVQLESLRDRGQLAQFHEVSQDKRTWVHASTLRELFGDRSASGQAAEVIWPDKTPRRLRTRLRDGSMRTWPAARPRKRRADRRAGAKRADSGRHSHMEARASRWLTLRDVPEFASLFAAAPGPDGASAQLGSVGMHRGAGDGGDGPLQSVHPAIL